MLIRDIMAKRVVTVRPDETVATAAGLMRDKNVGCLLASNGGTVEGIITDRDIVVRCLAEGEDARQCLVSQHMTRQVISAGPYMDVLDAARLMTEREVKRLPVVDGIRLVGVVSFSDVAAAMDRPFHDLLVGMGAARRIA